MRRQAGNLEAQPVEALMRGDVAFAALIAGEEVPDHAAGHPA
jgi:hypothetical protein